MSTKLPNSPQGGKFLLESESLSLLQSMSTFQGTIVAWLIDRAAKNDFRDLTPSHLALISALDCGKNYGSELARRLNHSRQAIYKTVRELEGFGFLAVTPNPDRKNSKIIEITARGEELIRCLRTELAKLDSEVDADLTIGITKQISDLLAGMRKLDEASWDL